MRELSIFVDESGDFGPYDHHSPLEIAYHPEPQIDPSRVPVLHYHLYDRSFNRTKAQPMPPEMIRTYKNI